MLTGAGLLLVLVVPCYIAMTAWRSTTAIYATTAVFGSLESLMIAPFLTTISESLPHAVRSAAFGILYAVAIAAFGGFTQFIIKSLIDLTGNPLAPAWYLSLALVIGSSAMFAVRESAPCRIAHYAHVSG